MQTPGTYLRLGSPASVPRPLSLRCRCKIAAVQLDCTFPQILSKSGTERSKKQEFEEWKKAGAPRQSVFQKKAQAQTEDAE